MSFEVLVQEPILNKDTLTAPFGQLDVSNFTSTVSLLVTDDTFGNIDILIEDDVTIGGNSSVVTYSPDNLEVVVSETFGTSDLIFINKINLVEDKKILEAVVQEEFLGTYSSPVQILVQEEFLNKPANLHVTDVLVGVSFGEYLAANSANVAHNTVVNPITAGSSVSVVLNDLLQGVYGKIATDDKFAQLSAQYLGINWRPSWSQVTDKPTEFTPAAHIHNPSDVNTFSAVESASWNNTPVGLSGFPVSTSVLGIPDGVAISGNAGAGKGVLTVWGETEVAYTTNTGNTVKLLTSENYFTEAGLSAYLEKSGGTITGDLSLLGDFTEDLKLSHSSSDTITFTRSKVVGSQSTDIPVTITHGTSSVAELSKDTINFFLTPEVSGTPLAKITDIPSITGLVTLGTYQVITGSKSLTAPLLTNSDIVLDGVSGRLLINAPTGATNPTYSGQGFLSSTLSGDTAGVHLQGSNTTLLGSLGAGVQASTKDNNVRFFSGGSNTITLDTAINIYKPVVGTTLSFSGSTSSLLSGGSSNILVDSNGITLDGPLTNITGDLFVQGTGSSLTTEDLNVENNKITLNSDFTTGTPTESASIEVLRGTLPTAKVIFNETLNEWEIDNGTGTAYKIYTPNNTGSGSGLDADKLDGQDSTAYVRKDLNNTLTGTNTFTNSITTNQPLKIVQNGVTTSIGNLNGSYCHLNTNSSAGFYFYDNLTLASGLSVRGWSSFKGAILKDQGDDNNFDFHIEATSTDFSLSPRATISTWDPSKALKYIHSTGKWQMPSFDAQGQTLDASVTGNAATAGQLLTPIDVNLLGDISGSVTTDLSGSVNITTKLEVTTELPHVHVLTTNNKIISEGGFFSYIDNVKTDTTEVMSDGFSRNVPGLVNTELGYRFSNVANNYIEFDTYTTPVLPNFLNPFYASLEIRVLARPTANASILAYINSTLRIVLVSGSLEFQVYTGTVWASYSTGTIDLNTTYNLRFTHNATTATIIKNGAEVLNTAVSSVRPNNIGFAPTTLTIGNYGSSDLSDFYVRDLMIGEL